MKIEGIEEIVRVRFSLTVSETLALNNILYGYFTPCVLSTPECEQAKRKKLAREIFSKIYNVLEGEK